ncbi:MAG TPA: CARDB domain-containing protein, partial [Acidobacteriota bacterium]|nr:CARDB domain-containing protein [Acidobacteriota bacterium]
TVNQKLADIIQAIQNSTQAQRKDEFYYLVYYNADSLKENLPWPCEPKMTATPDYGKHALGELHQIEATLFNQANGQPIDNELLTMEVLEGPHLGTIQEVLTDAQGKATLGYIGYAEGIDEIQIRTKQGTFAGKKDKNGQTGRPSGVETPMIKKTSEAKQTDAGGKDGAKLTKKQRKSLESDCSAWDVYSGKLFAEWEGYIDLATMLAPKASQVKPNDMLFLAATVYNFGTVASPATNLRFYMASAPFLPDNYPECISLGDLSVDALEPGTSFSCMQPVSIPSSVVEGTYYFEACVDPDGHIVQSAYWNDCASSTASLILALPGVVPLNHPPDCSGAVASVTKLWPPNHKLAGISIQGVTDPDGDAVTLSVTSITQDEPVNGLGDGDTSPDGFGVGTANPQVRAERSGTGNGRVYRINFKGTDAKGAECTGSVAVGVPHDKKDTPVDDGQNYDSTLQ